MQLFAKKMGKKTKAALNALAEGIECGAKLRPQVTGGLARSVTIEPREDGRRNYTYGTCALGAALDCALRKQGLDEQAALQKIRELNDYDAILQLYDLQDRTATRQIVLDTHDVPLLEKGETQAFSTLIWRLNDTLNWERERIAQFLRDAE